MIKYAPFTVKQANYIRRCQSCWLNVAEGGKRAGKNIINLVAWAAALDTHPDKIHLAAGADITGRHIGIGGEDEYSGFKRLRSQSDF